MRRRDFITLFGSATVWPIAARAQRAAIPVAGFLAAPTPPYSENIDALRRGLSEHGFVEGKNLAIEYRWAEGHYERLPALAAELVKRQVDVIVTIGGAAPIAAAKAATSMIPIVFHYGGDPVKFGFVKSLNRPGGNVTGVSFLTSALAAKRLELLLELLPTAKRVGVLTNPTNPTINLQNLQPAAVALGVELVVAHAAAAPEIDAAFERFAGSIDALFVDTDAFLLTRRGQIVNLAARHSLPSVYGMRQFAEAGGLISYGASITDAYRLTGVYAGRVLKGTPPADLPVMQSDKFELALNLKTAKTLGIDIPAMLLARAEAVIE